MRGRMQWTMFCSNDNKTTALENIYAIDIFDTWVKYKVLMEQITPINLNITIGRSTYYI